MKNIIPFAHQCLQEVICRGDFVLDATAGNGFDTCFLAHLVGDEGRVWAFDIQQKALENTAQRLHNLALNQRVSLILDGHQHLDKYIQMPISAAIFNLGYLPTGDKAFSTQRHNTRQAIEKSLNLLKVGGRLAVVVYSGHDAGKEEQEDLEELARSLAQQSFDVLRYQFANRPSNAPYALIFEKIKA